MSALLMTPLDTRLQLAQRPAQVRAFTLHAQHVFNDALKSK